MTAAVGSLFSGVGGLDLAVEAVTDGHAVWHCEPDKLVDKHGKVSHNHATDVLAARWPGVPNVGDITKVNWQNIQQGQPVDVLCGGFPCQDVSAAGLRAGMVDGTRSGLWTHFALAISHLRPKVVVIENVRGLLSAKSNTPGMKAIDAVLHDLTTLGYGSRRMVLAAANVGAPHRRDRVFIVAWPQDDPVHVVVPSPKLAEVFALLPTPRATRGGAQTEIAYALGGERDDTGDRQGNVVLNMPLLPTPRAEERQQYNSRDDYVALSKLVPDTVPLLPTPVALDAKGVRNSTAQRTPTDVPANPGDTLLDAMWKLDADMPLLPTPYALPGTPDWGKYEPAIRRWEALLRPAPYPVEANKNGRPRLAAAFSEWMMGWPAGWVTDLDMPRSAMLRLIGNGVVTRQAEIALTNLLIDQQI